MKSSVCLIPVWPAPDNVKAAVTTRKEGVSESPYDTLNLAQHVGDDLASVTLNRTSVMNALGVDNIQWLEQVHGTKVVEAETDLRVRTADGCFTKELNLVCAVLTADCLPLLMCDKAGTQVAAVHAGWRGLADGILAKAVESFSAPVEDLLVYLGPAISQQHFEVGIDVLEAFFESAHDQMHLSAIAQAFKPSLLAPMKYNADLFALARAELKALGVDGVYGGQECTYTHKESYYSYRRDGITGRMASLIWLT